MSTRGSCVDSGLDLELRRGDRLGIVAQRHQEDFFDCDLLEETPASVVGCRLAQDSKPRGSAAPRGIGSVTGALAAFAGHLVRGSSTSLSEARNLAGVFVQWYHARQMCWRPFRWRTFAAGSRRIACHCTQHAGAGRNRPTTGYSHGRKAEQMLILMQVEGNMVLVSHDRPCLIRCAHGC